MEMNMESLNVQNEKKGEGPAMHSYCIVTQVWLTPKIDEKIEKETCSCKKKKKK